MDTNSNSTLPPKIVYVDFDVQIDLDSGLRHQISVRSIAGEAITFNNFPLSGKEIETKLHDLQNAILQSTTIRRKLLSPEEKTTRDFGKLLFDFLLSGELRSRYDLCLNEAERNGKGTRIKLIINSPQLANLPWEYLYDERFDKFLCLSNYSPVIRYINLPKSIPPLQIKLPLRILGVVADSLTQVENWV